MRATEMRSVEEDRVSINRVAAEATDRSFAGQRRIPPVWLAVIGAGCVLGFLWLGAKGPGLVDWWRSQRTHPISSLLRGSQEAEVGAASAPSDAIAPDSALAPVRRPVQLATTTLGKNANEGYVALGPSGQAPLVYRSGAILANRTRITQVYADHIVLERDGRRADFYLPGREPRGYVASEAENLLSDGQFIPPASADSRDSLTEIMRLTPVYSDNSLVGVEVYANPRSAAFAKLGLEPGDRITAIDGETIRNPKAAIATLRRITEGSALDVSIRRGTQTMHLELDGSVLSAMQANDSNP
jgi:PDZ domain